MPGLAANPSIFEYLKLPEEEFEIHWLSWKMPIKNESIADYAKRMCDEIKHENSALLGVSFGGVLVQEMARYVKLKRLIIVSSVKSRKEIPPSMKLAGTTKLFKILPTSLVNYFGQIEKLPVGDFARKRIQLYKQYMSVDQPYYLDWAIQNMLCWRPTEMQKNVIHIHGDEDAVFPIKYIENPIVVKGGTHIMIINKYRWFNKHLPSLINENQLKKEVVIP
jgi:pimeloyl-ACP methyl ester carboxylesterase